VSTVAASTCQCPDGPHLRADGTPCRCAGCRGAKDAIHRDTPKVTRAKARGPASEPCQCPDGPHLLANGEPCRCSACLGAGSATHRDSPKVQRRKAATGAEAPS
jgi:hypothetical protein